jgi:hypothetical protein
MKALGLAGFCVLSAASLPAYAQEIDPFALPDEASSASDETSRLSTSLDFIHQSTYTPDLIRDGGRRQLENQTILDTILKWAATDKANFKARGVVSYSEKKIGESATHHGDLVALEYYYEQQFAGEKQVLSIGRKHLGWSAGFQWRPADLIDNGFSTKNIDTLDPNRYRGIDQVQYELIDPSFNFVAVLSNHERSFFKGNQFAAKLSWKRFADFSLMYAVTGSYSRKYGATFDTNLPLGTTLVVEAVHVDIDQDKLSDPFYFGETLESLSGIHSYEDVYVGLTKFIDDKRRINFEYFHNGRGLKGAFPGTASLRAAQDARASVGINPSIFQEEYLGRDYIYAAYTGYVDALKLQIKPSVLMNTGDKSYIAAISFDRELGGNSELSLKVNTFNGDVDSDFGSISRGVGFGASYILHLF